MTKDEALKLALEALEIGLPLIEDFGSTEQFNTQHKAVSAIYKALAQPEQEPVAWMYEVNGAHTILDLFEPPDDAYDEGTLHPLYTTPPQRKPLTDEEIKIIWRDIDGNDGMLIRFARSIEAAHGIKGEA